MAIRFKIVASAIVIFSIFCLAFGIPGTARAQQKTARLNEQNITDFIKKTSAITSGHKGDMSDEQVMRYLEQHLHKDAYFKSTMKYMIPGHPAQESSMRLHKEDFIESVELGATAVEDYENKIRIKTIKISSDGRKATIQTESRESAVMPVDMGGNLQEVPVEGASTCNQIIMLSKKDVIQMYNATCTTDIRFLEFQ